MPAGVAPPNSATDRKCSKASRYVHRYPRQSSLWQPLSTLSGVADHLGVMVTEVLTEVQGKGKGLSFHQSLQNLQGKGEGCHSWDCAVPILQMNKLMLREVK